MSTEQQAPSSVTHYSASCRDYKEGERSIAWHSRVTCESCRATLVKIAVLSLDEDRLK